MQLPAAWLAVRLSGTFDDDWYRLQYGGHRHELFKNRTPLLHYLYVGRKMGLTPSPFFVPEYYDRHRWNHSIVDPLVKYLVQRSNWNAITSVLFDGGRFKHHTRLSSPLAAYMNQLRKDKTTPVYDIFGADTTWEAIRRSVYEAVSVRRGQYELQKQSEPIRIFDEELANQTVAKTRSYFTSKNEPLVSIIMPAWNRQELIQAAIDSVLAQTYHNWELLIVDDGSTDATVDVVSTYAKRDKRIKLYTPGHGGVCQARNHGIEHAKGKWVAFLDSDNTWTPEYLTAVVATLDSSSKEVAYAAIKMNRADDTLYRATEPNPSLLEIGNHVDLNALIVKRTLLKGVGGFDTSLRRMVDYDLVIRLSKKVSFVYVPVVGVEYTDREDAARITTTESLSWDGVVKNNNYIDWENELTRQRRNGVSIVLPVKDNVFGAVHALKEIVATSRDNVDQVVVADASSGSALNVTMASIEAVMDGVVYRRFPAARDTVLAANYGYSLTDTDKVIFVDQHITVEPGWVRPIIETINDTTVVGPLQLQHNRTIRSAGVEYRGSHAIPLNILEDHPISDLQNIPHVVSVRGLMNGCFGIDATLFAKLRGLNPLYDKGFALQDLSLRADSIGSECKVCLESVVLNPDGGRGWYSSGQEQYLSDWSDKVSSKQSNLWKHAGFAVKKYEKIHEDMGEASKLRPVLEVLKPQEGQYRWAIKISSPADERRHIWGDTHYAEALARSLRKLGQRVAIDYHDHHLRPTSYLDDVVLDLRGLDDTQPQPGALNLMWIISHPEKVTPDIVKSFDLVFAAGKKWAEYMSKQSGKDIGYLPQCTDPSVFHPTKPDPKFEGRVIFVGSSRNVLRPIVRDAIKAGIDLDVYGGGWDGLIDSKYVKGTFIPNERLTYAYSSAAVVLNDHWDDMREWGFISNRIFDVLATGSPVVSDDIYGVHETVQSPLLATYDDNLAKTCKTLETLGNGQNDATTTAKYIKDNHSFDTRANELLQAVRNAEQQLAN
jgi:glycosyltransferase involved in cell wall biosynthesis